MLWFHQLKKVFPLIAITVPKEIPLDTLKPFCYCRHHLKNPIEDIKYIGRLYNVALIKVPRHQKIAQETNVFANFSIFGLQKALYFGFAPNGNTKY